MNLIRKFSIGALALCVAGVMGCTSLNNLSADPVESTTVAQVETVSAPEAIVSFEVAPNPDDKAAVAEWTSISVADQARVSDKVLEVVVPAVLKALNTEGEFLPQIGGYEGYVNPSYALRLSDTSKLVPATKAFGYVLKQKGMFVTSTEKVDGVYEQAAVRIKVPAGFTNADLQKLCTTLWETKLPTGVPLASGFSFIEDELYIIHNDMSDAKAAAADIRALLPKDYKVTTEEAFALYMEGDGADAEGRRIVDYGVGDNAELKRIRGEAEQVLAKSIDEARSARH